MGMADIARGSDAVARQPILQGQRVDHGGQHSHVIGGGARHSVRRLRHAPKNIPSPNNQSHLRPQREGALQFHGDVVNPGTVQTKGARSHHRLAGNFQQ
jgi:hypothetical protein